MRALPRIEIKQARRHGGDAEGCHEISRPNAAIENLWAVDRLLESYHYYLAVHDGGGQRIGIAAVVDRSNGDRGWHHDRARRRRRGEMDVVNLSRPCESAMRRNI